MVSQLLRHERIETTVAKAKELKRLADKVVTIAKEVCAVARTLQPMPFIHTGCSSVQFYLCYLQSSLHARRKAAEIVRGDDVMHKLFTTMAERYKYREGGYTRVLQTGQRPNDAARMAIIE